MPRKDYVKNLTDISKDTSKNTNTKSTMTGKEFYKVISNDVFIHHEIRHIFQLRPTFVKYTETDSTAMLPVVL